MMLYRIVPNLFESHFYFTCIPFYIIGVPFFHTIVMSILLFSLLPKTLSLQFFTIQSFYNKVALSVHLMSADFFLHGLWSERSL